MGRYINADSVKINYIGGFNDTFEIDYDSFMNAPAIDIIRCKECNAYMTDGYADGCGFCAYHHSVVQANDFCSYGERSR